MKMKNKKGWIRIVEAFIAILLIAGIMITIFVQQRTSNDKQEIINLENAILDSISQNDVLRAEILDKSIVTKENTNKFVLVRLPKGLEFSLKICEIGDECELDANNAVGKEVFVRERIISSTFQQYSPKRVKLFIGEK